MNTPVVLIFFNRPYLVAEMIKVLRVVKPVKIYAVSDCARDNVSGELELVESCRKIIETIDWDCDICKNYAAYNMGCDKRISSGLDMVFKDEDSAIILEDDCIPDASFFLYCEELLKKYKGDNSIKYISGTNQVCTYDILESYTFTYRAGTWGWATWKRAWNSQEADTSNWKKFVREIMQLKIIKFRERYEILYEIDIYRKQGLIPWDLLWNASVLLQDGLSIVPKVNLIDNQGFTEDATHTFSKPAGYQNKVRQMEFPLIHPDKIKVNKQYCEAAYAYGRESYLHKIFSISFYRRKVLQILNRVKKSKR